MIPRSYLYVPGDKPDMLDKAAGRGADALIVDLEDAVPFASKQLARDTVRAWLSNRDRTSTQVWVRLNPGDLLAHDVRAVADGGIDGVYLSKVSEVDELRELDRLLGSSDTAVVALVETARGILNAAEIAAAPRVVRMAIGEADLAAELRITPSPDGVEMAPMRAQIVLASAAAGIASPVAPVATDFRDLNALEASTRSLKAAGFGGRAAIHPAQIPCINGVFTPTRREIQAAQDLIQAYDRAGGGACVDASGRMVDEAVVRSARQVLAARRDDTISGEQ